MKKQENPKYRILVCTNEKAPGKDQCQKGVGESCAAWLKKQVAAKGLVDQVKVTRTGCLGYCETPGTAVVFEPMHDQYECVQESDLPQLFEEFLSKIDV